MTVISRTFGLAAAIATLLAGAEQARAATFTVDKKTGAADLAINGVCDSDATADVDCTLHAAVEEANATAAADTIVFNSTEIPGDPDDFDFIADAASGGLPAVAAPPQINEALTVNGGNCEPSPSAPPKPCAAVATGWTVDTDGEVLIRGVSFVGGGTGVRVIEATGTVPAVPDFQLYATWFGVDTLGAPVIAGAPSVGVQLEKVDGAKIGSGFETDRNFFSRYGTGLDILGADNTEVFGNVFGTLPNGSFPRTGETAANGDGIEITGDAAPVDAATGTEIGASSASSVATPACDFGCNRFAHAGVPGSGPAISASGIDLTAEAGEAPTSDVAILGNRIGDVGAPNSSGVMIGDADDVQIGGPASGDGDRNEITDSEIISGAGASGTLVENNNISSSESGTTVVDLQGSGAVLDNHVVSTAVLGRTIALANTSGPSYVVQGNALGETADGTVTGISDTGIRVSASASGVLVGGSGAGEGNTIADPILNSIGVVVLGDANQIMGNRLGVATNGSAAPLTTGIMLRVDADDNQIGGNAAAAENLISNTDPGIFTTEGSSIEVLDEDSDGNQILRNRGAAEDGIFIDLGGDGAGNLAEPNGPNGGAQAPVIGTLTATSAAGTAAPGAGVRLFTKATGDPGEIAGFLAETTADGSGAWSLTLPAQPVGQRLAATATTVPAGTSELSAVATVPAPPQPPPTGDTDPPETRIDKGPKKASSKRKAKFSFSADESGATFECRLDNKAAKPCSSPLKVKRLKRGKHKLAVTATDAAGNSDPTPAVHKFKVKKKQKR